MLALTDTATTMQILALVLLLREGKISRTQFEKAAEISPEVHQLFERSVERWMSHVEAKIRSEGN